MKERKKVSAQAVPQASKITAAQLRKERNNCALSSKDCVESWEVIALFWNLYLLVQHKIQFNITKTSNEQWKNGWFSHFSPSEGRLSARQRIVSASRRPWHISKIVAITRMSQAMNFVCPKWFGVPDKKKKKKTSELSESCTSTHLRRPPWWRRRHESSAACQRRNE